MSSFHNWNVILLLFSLSFEAVGTDSAVAGWFVSVEIERWVSSSSSSSLSLTFFWSCIILFILDIRDTVVKPIFNDGLHTVIIY